ncbi:MAG TPA: metalloregulator ArsR/SmtB family transcription factor [Acidobacteriota bacterium]|nr:metalloregulator ArsR/SmtB family transcription factor [Acidobacteriota bacterium]
MVEYRAAGGLDAVFSALADPTRRAILEQLRGGRASVTELAKPFRISYAAVSKHLAVLNEAGLIEMKKDGRIHWMHLRKGPLKEAVDWLDRYEQFWSERLDALERTLVSPKHSRRR